MTANLMCHSGARQVTLGDLEAVPVPPATETWQPVGHAHVVDMVTGQLDQAGFAVSKMQLALSKDDARFFGTIDLTSEVCDGVGLAIGVRNSLDKSFPLGFCCGDRCFVCDNLAFGADIIVTAKHTRNGEGRFADGIANAVLSLHGYRIGAGKRIDRFRQNELTDDRANSLILQSYRRGIVGARLLPKVCDQWEIPTHDEFRPRTMWSLLNAFSEAYKDRQGARPAEAAQETIRLQRFLEECNGVSQRTAV